MKLEQATNNFSGSQKITGPVFPRAQSSTGDDLIECQQILSADRRTLLGVDSMVTTVSWLLRGYDREIHEHSCVVADMAVRVGHSMGLKSRQLVTIRRAGLLHDFGKMALPRHFWRKTGAFSPAEVQLAQRHPRLGASMLGAFRGLVAVLPGVRYHHERFDGAGYPDGLRGERIPLIARVLTVVDCFSAMTSDRSYQRAMSRDEACRELLRCTGRQFDPAVVRVFIRECQPNFVD
ncbi:MAG TPA: HD domain-containing phosphohydrolase [Chloroflexota bacterium]|nr:HD domain-containing phosphohydrolase [Chloroflexota bacterium]